MNKDTRVQLLDGVQHLAESAGRISTELARAVEEADLPDDGLSMIVAARGVQAQLDVLLETAEGLIEAVR